MAGNPKKFIGWMAKASSEFIDNTCGTFTNPPQHLKIFINWQIIFMLLCSSYATKGPDIEGEALVDLLKCLNDSSKIITDWSTYLVSPCDMWSHVTCRNNKVVSLSLGSIGFTGTLGPSITKLMSLVSLDLQDNNLTGPLPDYLANIATLKHLNLANNNFNGPLPSTWGQLLNLKNLILSGNHLTGSIPEAIANISGLIQLDVSSNQLTGRIPVKLFSVPSFNFTGTHLSCGSSPDQPCLSSIPSPASNSKSKLEAILTSIGLGAILLLLAGIIFAYKYFHRNKIQRDLFVDVAGEDDHKVSLGQLRRFSWRELQLATDNFNESNVIGQGGFGKVYVGVLSDNTKVAVKRLTDYYSPGGEAAFKREVELISVAVHKNLLRLIGFCTTSTEKVLVYPFMQNLSVAYRLRELKPGENGLDWASRKRVAFGSAHGLEYLHEHCNPKIIHRDLKAANILLDDNFEPVLGDFGLAKLVDARMTHVTTQIRGTMGHIAPEYLSTGKSSEKTDVFGYGITLLELVTGQRAIDFSRLEEEEDVLLLDHIKKLQRENRLEDIVDRNMKTYDINEVKTIIKVALLCTQGLPENRPNMAEVVKLLEGEGLAERWAEWEQLEEVNQNFSLMSRQFAWADDFTQDQEAIQLSEAR